MKFIFGKFSSGFIAVIITSKLDLKFRKKYQM